MLAEAEGDSLALRVDVVRRLAPPKSAGRAWESLPFVDVDAALLCLRRFLSGDRLVAEVQCTACGAWGDLAFSIDAYLAAHRVRRWSDAVAARAPTVEEVLAAVREHGPAAAAVLEAAYLKKWDAGERRRAVAALERVAPLLSGPVQGACPECGAHVSAWFEPGPFVLAELRPRAAALFEDVHRLAAEYGWSEAAILAMPATRRAIYADFINRKTATP